MSDPTQREARRAALALVFNAFVWGTSWWPLRRLQEAGLHPLWATTIIFTLASLAIAIARPRACIQVATTNLRRLVSCASGWLQRHYSERPCTKYVAERSRLGGPSRPSHRL